MKLILNNSLAFLIGYALATVITFCLLRFLTEEANYYYEEGRKSAQRECVDMIKGAAPRKQWKKEYDIINKSNRKDESSK